MSDPNQREAYRGPAIACNLVHATLDEANLRLAFLEVAPGSEPIFRSAVMLKRVDAEALRDFLTKILERPKLSS